MKTIASRFRIAKANEVTLVHNKDKNILTEVTYDHSLVDLDGNVTHIFINNGLHIVVPQDTDKFQMYASKEDFEHEKPIEYKLIFVNTAKTNGHYKFVGIDDDPDIIGITSVSFKNGVPTETEPPVAGFKIILCAGYIKAETKFAVDDDVLDEYFDTVEHATLFHDYTITNKNGDEEVVKGRCHYLLPTEEQKPIVDELRAVIEKMCEAGLCLLYDKVSCLLHVYNCKQTEIEYDGEGVSLCDIDRLLPESIKLPNLIYDYNGDDASFRIREILTK